MLLTIDIPDELAAVLQGAAEAAGHSNPLDGILAVLRGTLRDQARLAIRQGAMVALGAAIVEQTAGVDALLDNIGATIAP